MSFNRYMINNYPEAVNGNDYRGYTPLHIAVRLGNEELVKILLSEGNANTGIQGHRLITPLHLAYKPSMIKLLMGSLTNGQDVYQKMSSNRDIELKRCSSDGKFVNPFKIAENYTGNLKVVTLESCNCNDGNDVPDCKLNKQHKNLKRVESKMNKHKRYSVLGNLVRHSDTAAISLLDEQIKCDGCQIGAKDAWVVYDFSMFQDNEDNEETPLVDGKDKYDRFSEHKNMMSSNSLAFEHPLSRVFIDLELQHFQKCLILGLLEAILFVFALSGVILWHDHLYTEHCFTLDHEHLNCSSHDHLDHHHDSLIGQSINISGPHNLANILKAFGSQTEIKFYCLYAFVCINLLSVILRETREACYDFKDYRNDNGNRLELLMILTTICYLVSVFFVEYKMVKHMAAWSIFLAWIEFLLMLSRFPRVGVYTIMFMNVGKKLLGYLIIYIPGVIAFSLAFHVLLHVRGPPFSRIDSAWLKTLAMMTGELNYEDHFDADKTLSTYSNVSTEILLVLFIAFIAIVLVNLLVGLAVSEIQKEKEVAKSLYNKIAVTEICRYWNNQHRGISFLTSLISCLFQDRSGADGVLKSLQKKLAKLKRKDQDSDVTVHSLKLCINPNTTRYRDGQPDGILDSTKKFFRDITGCQDTYEVFFYENIPSLVTENLDEWKTGYSLSKELVDETIKSLNKE